MKRRFSIICQIGIKFVFIISCMRSASHGYSTSNKISIEDQVMGLNFSEIQVVQLDLVSRFADYSS